jgi:hypothetical protein
VSHNRLRFDGLEELKAALRSLPADLTGEGGHIVEAETNAAEGQIKRGYPVRTGHLRDGVSSEIKTTGFSVSGIVKNTARHAYIFENGTQARHNEIGANRGSMPPGHVFIPTVIERRRVMYAELKDLLVRHGLKVSGDA